MSTTPGGLLYEMLCRQLDDSQVKWLDEQRQLLADDPADSNLHIALGMAPRRLGKADLLVQDGDLQAAESLRNGWDLVGLSVPDAARMMFLCELPDEPAGLTARFKSLCQTADVAESVALFRTVPLLRGADLLEDTVADGLRTNMKAVFEAIAHRNPYPREQFDEHRWNHMVLKALFIDSRLAPIQGLDERANASLARIMRDFAHERWAAERPVPFEIWRCVGPFADDAESLADLARVVQSAESRERSAGALALAACPGDNARKLLQTVPDEAARVASGELTWDTLN